MPTSTTSRHPINRACHTLGIPLILISIAVAITGFFVHRLWPYALALFVMNATPVRAEGRWCLSLSAGESVSNLHGSALDAALFAQLHPILGIGAETGFAYMNAEIPMVHGLEASLGSLTDGITRNRGYYYGPAVKLLEICLW